METETDNGPAKAWLDAAPPLYCADAYGNLVFHNDTFDKIASALFGKNGVADPTRQATPRALLDICNRLNAGGEVVTLRQCIIVDGKPRYYRSHHLQIADETGFTGHGGSYTDLTAEIGAAMPAADATAPIPIPGLPPGAWIWEADENLKLTYSVGCPRGAIRYPRFPAIQGEPGRWELPAAVPQPRPAGPRPVGPGVPAVAERLSRVRST